MEKLKEKIKWLFITHLGRIVIGAILVVIGGSLSRDGVIGEAIRNPQNYDNFDIFFWIMILGIMILLGYTIVMMAYAWVINPLRELKERKKKQ